jgi:glycosyltransferase involved in cell wall biosynthesis
MTVEDKLVSVIIPTFNSEKTIQACLDSIDAQTYRFTETIVVDCFSSDATVSISRAHKSKVLQSREKRSPARNRGAATSSGDYLMFLDSDMRLKATTIEDCMMLAQTQKFDSVIVPEISFGSGFWSRCIALEKKMYFGDELVESPCFFDKNCFRFIGGYDPDLEAGEDWDIFSRLLRNNFRVGHVDGLIYHDEGKVTLAKLFRKKYYYGQSISSYTRKNPLSAKAQLSPKRFVNKKSIHTLFQSPSLGLGLIMIKSIEFSGLVMGSRLANR